MSSKTESASATVEYQSAFQYAHSHTYEYNGETKVLAPIAVLKVDKEHPFPSNQGLNLVQIAELSQVGLQLVANVVIKLTNLLNFGAVVPARPDVPTQGVIKEAEKLGKEVWHGLEKVADDVVHDVVHGVEVAITDAEREAIHAALATLHDLHSALADIGKVAHELLHGGTKEVLADLVSELGKSLIHVYSDFTGAINQIAEKAGLRGQASSVRQFVELFQTIVVPDVLSTWQSDDEFARMRVAGPNPLVIERVQGRLPESFPVDEAAYQRVMGAEDSLADAIAEKRLYLADYRRLGVVEPGNFPAQQKYLSVPYALYAVPGGGTGQRPLKSVAIQLQQEPGGPIFYPFDGDSWELAKVQVQVADGNYHEMISHLGRTHLLIEPFVVSSYRTLDVSHPLFTLLLPHFQGTLFINNAAIVHLIRPGGFVDNLLSGTIEFDWQLVTNSLTKLNFDEWMLPNELERRGVKSPDLPLQYPYRDDAMEIWGAISTWVSDYLSLYFDGDAAVAADPHIQAWVRDLTSPQGGCIEGLGQLSADGTVAINTFDYLVRVVTMVIFTASAQHATVNFPQRDIMSYAPAMPLAAYAPGPDGRSVTEPQDALLKTLPPLHEALFQLILGQGLGGVYFTRLGDYDRHQNGSYFSDTRVKGPLVRFHENLRQIEINIGNRNLHRASYTTLLPSRIPQSINI